jgi:hypothetical protein
MSAANQPFPRTCLTGFANHLFPLISNQLKWPPKEVEQRTAYGVCLNSFQGIALLDAICKGRQHIDGSTRVPGRTGSSSAFIANRGIRTAKSESQEDASR